MSESINHGVGVSGDNPELIIGGYRDQSGKIALGDPLQDVGFILEQKLQVFRI